MKECRAPQTRKYWTETLGRYDDEGVRRSIATAEKGLRDHGRSSRRHHHDWTIFRNCAMREARKRGLL